MTDERGGRYFREARFFLAGDKVAAQSHILEARSLMGYMRDMHALGGPPIQVKYATLKDGTRIKATMMNGQYQAEIISPFGGAERIIEGYEVWVRPYWSDPADWDWLVTDDPGSDYGVVTSREDRRYYSNRMWQGEDKALHCIIGGGDDSRYFGAAGSLISVDGAVVYEGANIVGTAMFGADRVVVTSAVTYDIGAAYEKTTFTVMVGGYTYSTPELSAITYGYLQENLARRFSQRTVIFNSTGTEGSCVLGDTTVLTFTLSRDEAGDVSCTHVLAEIPGTDADVAIARIPTGVSGGVDIYAGCSRTAETTDAYTMTTGRQYTVAFACDYSPNDVLVFGLLRYDNTYRFSSAGTLAQTWTWTSCAGSGPFPTTYAESGGFVKTGYESAFAAGQPGVDCTVVSSQHGDLARSREGVAVTQTVGGRYSTHVIPYTQYVLDVVAALDLRYGFILTSGEEPRVSTVTNTLISDDGAGNGVRQVTYNYTAYSQYRFGARFHDGVPLVVDRAELPATPASAGDPVADSLPFSDPDGACAPCEGYYTVDNMFTVTMAPSDPAEPVRSIPRPRIFIPDLPLTDKHSYGFVYPTQSGDWSQALAFFTPEEGDLIVYSVHRDGHQDVSAEFDLGPRVDGNPTTKHFGVIHTRKKE